MTGANIPGAHKLCAQIPGALTAPCHELMKTSVEEECRIPSSLKVDFPEVVGLKVVSINLANNNMHRNLFANAALI